MKTPKVKTGPKDPQLVGVIKLTPAERMSTPYGRIPVSVTYGDTYPAGWMHHLQKPFFGTGTYYSKPKRKTPHE